MKRSSPLKRTAIRPKCVCGHGFAKHVRTASPKMICNLLRCACREYRPQPAKPLTRTALRRSTKPIKAKGKRRFPQGEDKAYAAWIRTQPCWLSTVEPGGWLQVIGAHHSQVTVPVTIDAAHIKSKGAGGADRDNMLPLAHPLHMSQHQIGIVSWAKKYGTTLTKMREAAKAYTAKYAALSPTLEPKA